MLKVKFTTQYTYVGNGTISERFVRNEVLLKDKTPLWDKSATLQSSKVMEYIERIEAPFFEDPHCINILTTWEVSNAKPQ